MSQSIPNTPPDSATRMLSNVFRFRQDLEWIQQDNNERSNWVARDPIALQYYYFSDLEKRFLLLLNGQRSLSSALMILAADRLNLSWAQQLLHRVELAGLLSCRGESVRGLRLSQLASQRDRRDLLARLLNPISIRVRLFDPSRVLNSLEWLARLMFNRWSILAVAMLLPVIAYLVMIQWMRPGIRLLSSTDIQWNAQLGLQLLVAYGLIKSLHELGHGLACKYHGVVCHEVGVMFLMFLPCLYCDTSDSWRLASRWKRASIAAAGIYIELLIAMIAAVVWLLTQTDSVLHLVSAHLMIAATASTILVNANPLMRYDGYYVLSDLWGVPNLGQQSQSAVRAIVGRIFIGQKLPDRAWDAPAWQLAPYGVAAKIYSMFLLVLILFGVWKLLNPMGLGLLAITVLAVVLLSLAIGLLANLRGTLRIVASLPSRRAGRLFLITTLLICVGSWLVLFQPVPTWVGARAVAEYSSLKPVYVRELGELTSCIDGHRLLQKGDVIASLRSRDLDLELIDIDGRIQYLNERLAELRFSTVNEESAATKIGETVEELAKTVDRRAIIGRQIAELEIRAEVAGVFVASGIQSAPTLTEAIDKTAWKPVLHPSNVGSTIDRGVLLGWIGSTNQFRVLAYVEQNDMELIKPGATVTIRWDGIADQPCRGIVKTTYGESVSTTPESLIGDTEFNSRINSAGESILYRPHYEVVVQLDSPPAWLTHHCVATVHISTEPRTLWQSIVRYVQLNFRSQLVQQDYSLQVQR